MHTRQQQANNIAPSPSHPSPSSSTRKPAASAPAAASRMALQDTSISTVNKQEALKLKDDGNALFKEQKFIKAAGSYTKAAKKDPSNPILHCNLAMALLKISKFDKAALAAQKCVDLDPEFEKGHYRLALAFLGAEKYAEAITAFEETARINPNNKDAVKKVQVAAWECRKFHKAEGTEPPECALKYRKEDTPAEVEAKEAKAKVKKFKPKILNVKKTSCKS